VSGPGSAIERTDDGYDVFGDGAIRCWRQLTAAIAEQDAAARRARRAG